VIAKSVLLVSLLSVCMYEGLNVPIGGYVLVVRRVSILLLGSKMYSATSSSMSLGFFWRILSVKANPFSLP